jgi:suppressor of fused
MTGEYQAVLRWNTGGVLDLIRRRSPLLITDLDRSSITEDASLQQELEQRSRAEGSTTGLIFNDSASWRIERKLLRPQRIIVSVGAMAARQAAGVLAARLPHGRSFTLVATGHQIEFEPGAPAVSRFEDTCLTLTIPSEQVDALIAALQAPVGEYTVAAINGLVIDIQPSLIRDPEGVVVKEIR